MDRTSQGLGTLNGKNFELKDGLPPLDVHAITEDTDGNLWVGTGGGMFCLHEGQITEFHKTNGLPSEDISSLLADSDGALWIGTRGNGLARFAKKQWSYYTTSDGLAGNSIGYLVEDNETNLWIGSNSGLTRVAKKSLNDLAQRVSRKCQSLPLSSLRRRGWDVDARMHRGFATCRLRRAQWHALVSHHARFGIRESCRAETKFAGTSSGD